MIKFKDGPAAGAILSLRRAPLLIRAVQGPRAKWDALDQVDDVVNNNERPYLYILAGPARMMHMRCCGKGGKAASGFWAMGEYQLLPAPPDESILRDNTLYAEWCDANRDRIVPEWFKAKVEKPL